MTDFVATCAGWLEFQPPGGIPQLRYDFRTSYQGKYPQNKLGLKNHGMVPFIVIENMKIEFICLLLPRDDRNRNNLQQNCSYRFGNMKFKDIL